MKRHLSEAQHALHGLGELLLFILCSGGGIIALLLLRFFYRHTFVSVLLGIFGLSCSIATFWLMRSGWHGILIAPLLVGVGGTILAAISLKKHD